MGKSRNEDSGFNEDFRDQLARVTVPPELDNEENRKRWKLESLKHKRGPYLIELNVQYKSGLPGAANEFLRAYEQVCRNLAKQDKIPQADRPEKLGESYYRCDLRVREWRAIVAEDERLAAEHARKKSDKQSRHQCIYRLWPDFPVRGQISRSVSTIKADAALRSFEASGEEITWRSSTRASWPTIRILGRRMRNTSSIIGASRFAQMLCPGVRVEKVR